MKSVFPATLRLGRLKRRPSVVIFDASGRETVTLAYNLKLAVWPLQTCPGLPPTRSQEVGIITIDNVLWLSVCFALAGPMILSNDSDYST